MNAYPDGRKVTTEDLRQLCVEIGVDVDAIGALHNEGLVRTQYISKTAQIRFELMCAGFLDCRTEVYEPTTSLDRPRQVDVGMDAWDFTPVPLDTLAELIKES